MRTATGCSARWPMRTTQSRTACCVRGLGRFDGRSSFQTWIYRIATNVCLDLLARRSRRTIPTDYPPAEAGRDGTFGTAAVEPYPDGVLGLEGGLTSPEARYEQREALELAFVGMLQQLPARQRAVLVLRDVLGFSSREAAAALDTTTASVNSALQRARATMGNGLPERSQQATLRQLGDRRVQELADRFVAAFERADVEAVVATLSEEATFRMPPATVRRGRREVRESWLMPSGPPGSLRYVPTRANAQIAFGVYALEPDGRAYTAIALDVLTFGPELISDVVAFRGANVLDRFALPRTIEV